MTSKKFLEWPKRHVFNYQKIVVEGVLFLTNECLILSAFKQKVLEETRQSNGIKPPKNLLFQDYLYVSSSQSTFFGLKVSFKNIFTFYLKHQKYPFCAPNFHPISIDKLPHW